MSRILGPTEAWPRHPHKEWNRVLDFARALGWSLRLMSGHSWGKLQCNVGAGFGVPGCDIAIFSTGRNPEQAARLALLKVQRCRHKSVRDHDAY